jgi:hypothetical protein
MITALGFTTRGRPDYLYRCAKSFVASSTRHGHRPRLLVMDDALPGAHPSAQPVAEQLAEEHPQFEIYYAGQAEREAFVDALADAGISSETAEFALLDPEGCGYRLGANRNALQLATPGEHVLFIDDDCLADTARPPQHHETLAVAGPGNTQEYWFYPDHVSALGAASSCEADLVGLHERYLGRPCAAIMDEAGDDVLKAGGWADAMRTASTVKVTQNGLVGDSCMFSNIGHLLHGSPSTHKRMTASAESLHTAMSSREIIRCATHPTLRLGGLLIGPDFACDHSTLLPPFFPVFRASDTCFSNLLSLAYPEHAMADVPVLVTHRSLPGRGYSGRGVSELWRCSAGEVIRALLFTETAGAYRSLSDPLRTIGERMLASAELKPQAFAELAQGLVDGMIEQKARRLKTLRETADGAPHYAQLLDVAIATLSASARHPLRARPVELAPDGAPELATPRLQRLALRFSRLLVTWQAIDAAARELAAGGIGLAQPVRTRSRS